MVNGWPFFFAFFVKGCPFLGDIFVEGLAAGFLWALLPYPIAACNSQWSRTGTMAVLEAPFPFFKGCDRPMHLVSFVSFGLFRILGKPSLSRLASLTLAWSTFRPFSRSRLYSETGRLYSETPRLYSETGTVVFGNWNGCIRKLGFGNYAVVFGNWYSETETVVFGNWKGGIRKLRVCIRKLVFGNYTVVFGNWYSETETVVFGNSTVVFGN